MDGHNESESESAKRTVTLKLAISAESLALNEIAPFLKWAFIALGSNVPKPKSRAALAKHVVSLGIPGFAVNEACKALGAGDAVFAQRLFPKARKPIDWLALALLCVAEQAYWNLADDQSPANKTSWWRQMSMIQRIESAVGAWRGSEDAIRDRQKAASQVAHAAGDEVRRRVLYSFDSRPGEWRTYADAARALYREHYAPDMPWSGDDALRRFLVRERRGVLTSTPGRPRK